MKISIFSLFLVFSFIITEASLNVLMAGDVPLETDDTGTPGHNKWEINLCYKINKAKLEDSYEYSIDANYGLGKKTQLNIIIPYNYIRRDEENNVSHLGDIQLATKYRFIDESDWFVSVSTDPTIFLPTGNHRSKLDFFLPLEIDKHIKDLYIGTEVGYTIHRKNDEENELFYGVFSEYRVWERIDFVGEVFGKFIKHAKTDAPQFNVGLRYKFNKLFTIMGSAGRSFEGRDSGGEDFHSYAGFRFEF